MALEIEATYQNGVLKPDTPLPIQDNQRVRLTIHETTGRARRNYGLMGWKGDAKTIEKLAMDPEFGIQESP